MFSLRRQPWRTAAKREGRRSRSVPVCCPGEIVRCSEPYPPLSPPTEKQFPWKPHRRLWLENRLEEMRKQHTHTHIAATAKLEVKAVGHKMRKITRTVQLVFPHAITACPMPRVAPNAYSKHERARRERLAGFICTTLQLHPGTHRPAQG